MPSASPGQRSELIFPERDSLLWHHVWSRLEAHLRDRSDDPVKAGGVCDYMLMQVEPAGIARFKHIGTREYVVVPVDQSMIEEHA